jgi:dipeptidase E
MKLLLASAGVRNASMHAALVDVLGRPVADCTALCIPTALHGHPWVGPGVNDCYVGMSGGRRLA